MNWRKDWWWCWLFNDYNDCGKIGKFQSPLAARKFFSKNSLHRCQLSFFRNNFSILKLMENFCLKKNVFNFSKKNFMFLLSHTQKRRVVHGRNKKKNNFIFPNVSLTKRRNFGEHKCRVSLSRESEQRKK